MTDCGVPTYRQLLAREDAPAGSSWGVFGADDELGTLNFITPTSIMDALTSVSRGATFNLDYSLSAFNPPLSAERSASQHHIYAKHEFARDDWLDNFYLQASSQIDGLRHRRHRVHGFYNAVADEQISVGTSALGINRWSEHGIVGRGVLVDVDRYLRRCGRPLDFARGDSFDVNTIDAAAVEQGVIFRPGDILLIRTGWAHYYFNELDSGERRSLARNIKSVGLCQERQTLEYMWDHRFSLIAADNVALEVVPPVPDSPFLSDPGKPTMHQEMIALLGMAIGELWSLDELALDSREHGRYDCLLVSKPLNLVGGCGSPANAIAIR